MRGGGTKDIMKRKAGIISSAEQKNPTHYSSSRTEAAVLHVCLHFFCMRNPGITNIHRPPLPGSFLANRQTRSREANGKKPSSDFSKNIAGTEVPKNEHRGQFQLEFVACLYLLFPFITAQHGVQAPPPWCGWASLLAPSFFLPERLQCHSSADAA